jgi:hypothetical protein
VWLKTSCFTWLLNYVIYLKQKSKGIQKHNPGTICFRGFSRQVICFKVKISFDLNDLEMHKIKSHRKIMGLFSSSNSFFEQFLGLAQCYR